MKILYHHRIASKDGQYVHVEELTQALKRLGHEIIMVCPDISENSSFGSEGGLVPLLKRFIPGFIYELMELAYAVYSFVKLNRAIKQHNPDCLYERYNLYTPAGVWVKRRYNLPMLLEVNAPIFQERNKYDGIALPRLARWSEHYTWNGADVVLPVTHVLARYVKAEGVSGDKIDVIPNGIDPNKFQELPDTNAAKQQLGLEGCLVLGFTGFVREWHGLDKVVELLCDSDNGQNRHLLVVGDGPARPGIEKRAAELGVSNKITFTGVISRDRVAHYVASFDVALQPDVVAYASPLKMFEYMVLGRAIVAPNTENIREILKHDVNAVLFEPERQNTMCEAIELLCMNEQLRARLSQSARETIFTEGFTWENNALRVVRQFERLLANPDTWSSQH